MCVWFPYIFLWMRGYYRCITCIHLCEYKCELESCCTENESLPSDQSESRIQHCCGIRHLSSSLQLLTFRECVSSSYYILIIWLKSYICFGFGCILAIPSSINVRSDCDILLHRLNDYRKGFWKGCSFCRTILGLETGLDCGSVVTVNQHHPTDGKDNSEQATIVHVSSLSGYIRF